MAHTRSDTRPHAPAGSHASNALHQILVLGGLLVGLGLRLHRLGSESLWYDETVSVVLARKPPLEMLAHTAGDIHPPGYYLWLHVWQWLARPTLQHGLEFLFAWPSLWCGVLIMALLYPLGRRLLDKQTALLALWLAAVNPFHIWYSQEVRMYTLGAFLGLLCLWALLDYFASQHGYQEANPTRLAVRPLVVYVVAAAFGLYTLYYFIFLLMALNGIALYLLWRLRPTPRTVRRLLEWLAAQCVVLLLWLPWLPIFWRQATDPPVPPWRAPWQNAAAFAATVGESLGVLLFGEAMPLHTGLLWMGVMLLILLGFYGFLRSWPRTCRFPFAAAVILLSYTFVPLALIYILTATVTPLYHARYLFTYAPPFLLIVAAALLYGMRWRPWLGGSGLLAIVLLCGWSLHQFWTAPAFRTDDHRAAVAQLAADWRPGDAILVNAGWVYTVFETYWPTQPTLDSAIPPPIAAQPRLTAYAAASDPSGNRRNAAPDPILVRTGSVDGLPNLGWGNAQSDFYAISRADTAAAIAQLTVRHPRIWHYRLYDTVNDPEGVIRSLLNTHAVQRSDVAHPGRDFLRVQQYETDAPTTWPAPPSTDSVTFGHEIRLDRHGAPTMHQAGNMLYVHLGWTLLVESMATDLNSSLRLYDVQGRLLTQADAALNHYRMWSGPHYDHWLALPVPTAAPPGPYSLELIIYRRADGTPLPVSASGGAADEQRVRNGQRWPLGSVELQPAPQPPAMARVRGRFDYIDLVRATLDRVSAAPGERLHVDLVWRPRPNAYRDTYTAILELRNAQDVVMQSWAELAGGLAHPSGAWPFGRPVSEQKVLPLAPDLPAGTYTLTLRLARASDGLPVAAQRGWLPLKQKAIEIGTIVLQ